jgi:hypothetical protein
MTSAFDQWSYSPSFLRRGHIECDMGDSMLDLFYNGLTPLIQNCGYKWSVPQSIVASKFLKFAFLMHETLKMSPTTELRPPEPMHRNLTEDRETFDMYFDAFTLGEFIEAWKCYDSVIDTRLDYMIKEFCYVWVDVESGKPGAWTNATLEMNTENISDDDTTNILPDRNWNKQKKELY